MQLASSLAFPEPLLAAMPQLSEKPHLGFSSKNPAWHPGFNVCNCTAVLGLQFRCSGIVSGPVVASNNAPPQQPSCSQQASAAAAQVPKVAPSGWDVANGAFWSTVGVVSAVASAPEDGPLAPVVGTAVARGGAGFVGGLFKNAVFNAGAKAFAYGVSYSNCVTPSSAPYFSAP